MDTTQSTVSNFERMGGDPKLSTVLRYAEAIGADVRFLVTIPRTGATVRAQSVDAGMPRRNSTQPFLVAMH
jgi:transcriptional regulator with XRE-family HTH domain